MRQFRTKKGSLVALFMWLTGKDTRRVWCVTSWTVFHMINFILSKASKRCLKGSHVIKEIMAQKDKTWNAHFDFCVHLDFGSNALYVWNAHLHFTICVHLHLIWHNSHFDYLLNSDNILFKMRVPNVIHNHITSQNAWTIITFYFRCTLYLRCAFQTCP